MKKGEPFKINLFTGASTNDHVDGESSPERMPSQGAPPTRVIKIAVRLSTAPVTASITFDAHLSHLSQDLRYGFTAISTWPSSRSPR